MDPTLNHEAVADDGVLFRYETELTLELLSEVARHTIQFSPEVAQNRRRATLVFVSLFVLAAVVAVVAKLEIIAFSLGLLSGAIATVMFALLLAKNQQALQARPILGKRKVAITRSGIVSELPHAVSEFDWPAIETLRETPNCLVLLIGPLMFVPVPKTDLSETDRQHVIDIIENGTGKRFAATG